MVHRVCVERATGRLIESQSGGGEEHLEVLEQNAIAAGYDPAAIECRVVDDEEYRALRAAEVSVEPDDGELYDTAMASDRVLRGLLKAINEGDVVPGARASEADLRAAIVGKMGKAEARRLARQRVAGRRA